MGMELGGRNLWAHIEQNGPLPPDRLLPISQEICEALQYLHDQEIIHRDVKPHDFVVERQSDQHVKMIDFGIAKYVGEDLSARPLDQLTQEDEFVGPVHFASPELVAYARDKKQPVDLRSDIFQAGKVVWYLATGKITAGIPSKKDCPLGGRLRQLLVDVLSDDPDDRPSSAKELADALSAAFAPKTP
jgi:serine/threonine-protein kinase